MTEHIDADFYPTVEEIYQDEYVQRAIPVCIDDPVRVQVLPTKTKGLYRFDLNATTPQKVLEKNPKRKRAILTAVTNPVQLASNQSSALGGYSFLLPTGVLMELTSEDELWAVSSTSTASLSVINEEWSY